MIRDRWTRIDRIRTSRVGAVLFYGYLVAIIAAGILIGQVVLSNRTAVRESHRALCGIKLGYQRQLTGTWEFLRSHPQGTQDFPRVLIVRSIHSTETDLSGLRDITCPKEAP